ncbi:hypothetical protein CLA01_27660 [Chryseobacterium lathyri]|jgi:hypothetical protein|uniref:Uncharacterized protein n=1 Tax=Chryseobacterium lathyri TaxID=395933 RepID=A0A511YBZ3_9FLAO|nr:hypothetical protein CLA01_27660 [Chryseobacterium lathyri]
MKKNVLTLVALLVSAVAFSQVGINTANPQGVFNIDGGKDNNTTGVPTATQQANDIVVTTSGQLGIGTTQPRAKLHVAAGTAIQIDPEIRLGGTATSDGNAGNAGDVITSQGPGMPAKWATIGGSAPLVVANNGNYILDASYNALLTDDIILMKPTAVDVTLNFPAGAPIGKKYYISNQGTRMVLTPQVAVKETATQHITAGAGYTIMYLGPIGGWSNQSAF